MKTLTTLKKLVIAAGSMVLSATASADVIDFKAMAESGGALGESIWDPYVYTGTGFTLSVTGTKGGNDAYAYFDSGNAGLGVCGEPVSDAPLNTVTNSSSNLCSPSSDDNVTVSEALHFVFDVNVMISSIFLNNNHDPDQSLFGDTVDVGGNAVTFSTNYGGPADYPVPGSFLVTAGSVFTIAHNDEEFYVSKMTVDATVPEPETMVLLALGLLGLGLRRRTLMLRQS